ncbi:MAG: hypothetical protein ACTHMT_11430 [Verrucomicrobiota bacterium]
MAKATIELEERVAAALLAQAEAQHLPLDTFLERIVSGILPQVSFAPATEEEWNQMFDAVSAKAKAPSLQAPLSREDLYFDHD